MTAGDQIVAVDGVAVTRVDEVLAAIKAKRPGDTIVFTVITRAGHRRPTARPAARPARWHRSQRTISVVLGVYEPAV